jgi:hypothetical protein
MARIQALLARASDPGASEEEQRTSAAIAVKLMRKHGLGVAPPAAAEPEGPRRAVSKDVELAVAEHFDNAGKLVSVIARGSITAAELPGLFDLLGRATAAVNRDVRRVRASVRR